MSKGRTFAYLANTAGSKGSGEMLCVKCALQEEEPLQNCYWEEYSFGHEVIGCNRCEETIQTPF